ncbi:MAG: DUF192 domain-containing protein [Gemmatimonas sp.]|nr:DUF192 domain-containing protein [Gemmatimonas sp.]
MKRLRSTFLLLACSVSLGIVGCADEEPIPEPVDIAVEFGSGTVIIESAADTFTMGVDVAESATQRARGLMQRASMDPDSGMIFLFPNEQGADESFWMYNTLIPLSIAFLGGDGRIGSIREMEPCTSPYPQWCIYYEAGVPFHSALEANAGYFEARGVEVGDRVSLSRD